MKRQTKIITLSALSAIAFAGIGVGTTFALFTSKAETNISVKTGTVKVEQSSSIVSVFELNDVEVTASQGVYTNSIGGKTYIDPTNSSVLHLENWAPGDKVRLELDNINKSNVVIKSRFNVSHESTSTKDLSEALNVQWRAYDEDDQEIVDFDEWQTYEAATNTTDGYLLGKVLVEISFPNHDNGEIVYGDNNQDNPYQNSNCTFYFTLEAVQGNASVANNEPTPVPLP